MNQRPARDWTREPWIKQHIREPLDELLWPLMQRAVREYLRKKAESDGTLIVDRDDPIEALIHALGAHAPELGLARQAVLALVRDGVLETDGRSIWMPERPASQARVPALFEEESAASGMPSKPPRQTSTNRVRDHRERKRNERNAQAGVSSPVPAVPEAVSSGVSLGVSPSVSPSRGNRIPDPLHSEKDQKDQKDQKDRHHHLEDARVSGGVSASVPSSVSRETADDDEDETVNDVGSETAEEPRIARGGGPLPPTSLAIAERAALLVDNAELADTLRPDRWAEVTAVAAAFALGRGCPSQPLGRYAQDKAVQHLVALYAAGYSQADLVHVVRVVAKQEWTKGKGLGSLLTFKVVDANRPMPLVKADRALSPEAASILARVREGRAIREAG